MRHVSVWLFVAVLGCGESNSGPSEPLASPCDAIECANGFYCADGECFPDGEYETECFNCSGRCIDNRCVVVPLNYVALITDVTTGDGCMGPNPGSDIVFASLEDEAGTVLGYATLDYDGTTGDDNTFNLGANIDGVAPSFPGTCPEFDETSVTALGCGGEIGVRFLDVSGTPIVIQPGMQIRVFEYGGQCSSRSFGDEYEVVLCTDTNAVVNDNNTASCTQNLGGGSGETVVSI